MRNSLIHGCLWSILFLMLASCKENKTYVHIKTPIEKISGETKQACEIYFQNDTIHKKYLGRIKIRGGISRRYDKHSYSLELDEKFDFMHLPSDDDWILNASYIDKTFLRHKLSYDLFRSMGLYNQASLCDYLNVKHNDRDVGLYVLMEEINAGKLKLSRRDSSAVLFKDPPIFQSERLKLVQDSTNYYQQKFPKKDSLDHTETIEKLKAFLFNSSDKEFLEHIEQYFDLNNIRDWHILLLLTNNADGVLKNFYLYKKNSVTPFRIAIWDYDHSFGRDGDNEYNMMERPSRWQRAILLRRLMDIPNSTYPSLLRQRWFDLRKTGTLSVAKIKEMMAKDQERMKPYLKHNQSLWPLNSKWYYDDNSYKEEIEIMHQFIELRIPQLDQYFSEI